MSKNTSDPKSEPVVEINRIDWERVEVNLSTLGYSHVKQVLEPKACLTLRKMYSQNKLFRKRIVMEEHNFGIGDYAYFSEPLPKLIFSLRRHLAVRTPHPILFSTGNHALCSISTIPQLR